MPAPLSVTILYNKSNTFGLAEDVLVWERILKALSLTQKPRLVDLREPLIHSDIQIHLEIPVYAAIPWAHTNVLLVNPEHWSEAYDGYVHAFDALLFRDPESTASFRERLERKGVTSSRLYTIPWCAAWHPHDAVRLFENRGKGFLCLLGGSANKCNYLKKVLPHWRKDDPPLTIYTSRKDMADELRPLVAPFMGEVVCQDLSADMRHKIMAQYRGHLVVSEAEGFGYAAADAEAAGAFTVMNALPVFTTQYAVHADGVAWLGQTECSRAELVTAFDAFHASDPKAICSMRQARATQRFEKVKDTILPLVRSIQSIALDRRPSKGVFHCPPILHAEDCPPITVITPTYNRKMLIDIAFHNLLATDYPHDKIEWIVIEDNEKTPHMAGEKVMNFQMQAPKIRVKYMPIEGRLTIGQKRNLAIEQATHNIILFMDDDDHYPTTSFRRRVAWLTEGTKCGQTSHCIACCTTLALYDLKRGVSAVNVPPYELPLSQRMSEATLTFYKIAWEERKFPDVSISEGEGWIEGREDQVLEMPPQQIIVAFSHGGNQTTRRIPEDQPPSCFWGFPKEYLVFIHGLAGVTLEK
jgi:hypothetical protein